MLDQPTRDLADAAGILDGALANIADELHTALVDLNHVASLPNLNELDDVDRFVAARARIERLSAYVAEVQTRTKPAAAGGPFIARPVTVTGLLMDTPAGTLDPGTLKNVMDKVYRGEL